MQLGFELLGLKCEKLILLIRKGNKKQADSAMERIHFLNKGTCFPCSGLLSSVQAET